MGRKRTVSDFVVAHPMIDLIAPTAATIAAALWVKVPGDMRADLLSASSTVGALVLTAGTFCASMVYSSSSEFMVQARTRFHDLIARNWRSVLLWCFIATIAPLTAFLLPQAWTAPVVAGSIAALAAKFTRCLFWFHYVLTLDIASVNTPRLRHLKPADDLRMTNGA